MKNLYPLLLLILSATASADWVKIDSPVGALSEKFIDVTTIRQTGPMNTMRRVWEVTNLHKGSANKVLSIKQYMEYDCKDRRSRVIEEHSFSEHWAQGENLTVDGRDIKAAAWSEITPASINETLFNRVCPNG